MISKELQEQFINSMPVFEESIQAFEKGEIDRNKLKGVSGGFGSYAQREGGYMVRLRLPGGRVKKETLKFIAEESLKYGSDLLKLTTCQAIQVHNLNAENTVAMVRDALDFGIITCGGGGDNPRNVTASPLTGVAADETFDVTPYVETVGDYLLTRMPELHMPRKLKVGFSNTPANETHANFRDLGFIANADGTFSVYCAGGLGPNPKLGVLIADKADPKEVTLYASAMIRLFTTYGNYDSRAKARTRYMQETLGAEGLRQHFLEFLEEVRKEEKPWPVKEASEITKSGEGEISPELIKTGRITAQKQPGLYTVSYHPVAGRMKPEKAMELYRTIADMEAVEIRVAPTGTLYIINLTASEAEKVSEITKDGANSPFEASISCIGGTICQHGLRDSGGLVIACVERARKEDFAPGVLPMMHVSGCPSSCGSHQVGAIGFIGHTKKVNGVSEPAFKLYAEGCDTNPGTRLGEEIGVIAQKDIPEFLVELGHKIQDEGMKFDTWYPKHREEFMALAKKYAEK